MFRCATRRLHAVPVFNYKYFEVFTFLKKTLYTDFSWLWQTLFLDHTNGHFFKIQYDRSLLYEFEQVNHQMSNGWNISFPNNSFFKVDEEEIERHTTGFVKTVSVFKFPTRVKEVKFVSGVYFDSWSFLFTSLEKRVWSSEVNQSLRSRLYRCPG